MVNDRLKQIQSWLWPGSCLLCRARLPAGEDFCAGCAQSLPRLEAACPRCAAALGAPSTEACGECQKRPPAFDRARALFTYAAPVDRLILRLKYHRQLYLARVLGEALGAFIAGLDDAPRMRSSRCRCMSRACANAATTSRSSWRAPSPNAWTCPCARSWRAASAPPRPRRGCRWISENE